MSEKSVKSKIKRSDAKQAHAGHGTEPASHGFYGSVTVGERGQIVIPKEAREAFNIQPGERLILVGHSKKGLMLAKADELREFAKKLLENVG
ncbi:AbrB/MazE/SpoVT family DNA-binding domain-containing protein [Candidatus Micrarchaeota archaeon]|nr:AbrB/MazE/SpoVT family DNA-binding domain-containing protein [Candidatus Micrarchaeota archaeon]